MLTWFKSLFQRKEVMLQMVLPMVANMLKGLMLDKAQTLAKEHIEKAIDEHFYDDAKKELDKAIQADGRHEKNSLKELLS